MMLYEVLYVLYEVLYGVVISDMWGCMLSKNVVVLVDIFLKSSMKSILSR